jgi:hypothetical protein
MQKIRKGVFETNSSSTHSICIESGSYVADKIPLKDGVCKIYPGEFGWEVEDYSDAATKASYCLVYAIGSEYDKDEPVNQNLDMLKSVLKEVTGAKDVEFVLNVNGYNKWGYIDHQSSDVCSEAFTSREKLKDFIFNPESILHTDNDNR